MSELADDLAKFTYAFMVIHQIIAIVQFLLGWVCGFCLAKALQKKKKEQPREDASTNPNSPP